jgi:hypothetical protein
LIKAKDWNELVAAVDGLTASLAAFQASTDARFDALDARIGTIDSRVATVEGLAAPVAALLAVNRRLELKTPSAFYALGQLATIEARIGSLPGAPQLDLGNAATRPWVDFFATWGELQPAPGTEVRAGGGHRSLSVRVDAQGVAKALLRAETSRTLPVASEAQVDATLATQVLGRPLSSWILAADTPTAAEVKPVFERISVEYQRVDARHVRDFVDQRFEHRPSDFTLDPGVFQPIAPQTWNDERSTVIAILKPDAAPETADASLGVSSLEVRFRDWTRPWFYLDFLPGSAALETDFRDRFGARGGLTFEGTLDNFRKEANERIAGLGPVGRVRAYKAMDGALDKLAAGEGAPGQVREASDSMRRAIRVERSVRSTGEGAFLLDSLAASDALSGSKATGAQTAVVGTVQQEVKRAREDFRADVQSQMQNVDLRLTDFRLRVDGVSAEVTKKADLAIVDRLLPRG